MKETGWIIGVTCLLLSGCTEFFTKDISETEIQINSPADSLYTSQDEVTFWWETNSDIEKYRLQVVSPGFDNPSLIFDTLFSDHILFLTTDEGRYLWRLRGENEGSQSEYQTRSFVIDKTPPLVPTLTYPGDNQVLGASSDDLKLQWQSQDPPINDVSFALRDSVYLFEEKSGNVSLLKGYQDTSQGNNELSIGAAIPTISAGDTLSFQWQVRSIDEAGNRTESGMKSFRVTQ